MKEGIAGDLAGDEGLSSRERALVDMAVRTKLCVDHLDAWLIASLPW
jgi:hypothetical protein